VTPRRILILEGVTKASDLVRQMSPEQSLDVRTVSTAEDGIRKFQEFRPEIVLAEADLPTGEGLAFVKRLKAEADAQGAIILGFGKFAGQDDRRRALEAGCVECVGAPASAESIRAAMQKYFQGSGSESGSEALELAQDPDLRELQAEFVADTLAEVERFIGEFESGFDDTSVRRAAHRWAGSGGSVGYPEVTRIARELETWVQGNGREPRTRELLDELQRTLVAARGEGSKNNDASSGLREEVTLSALTRTLAGKRFALVGFPQQEAVQIAQAIERYQAFSRKLADDTPPDADATRPFDALIVKAVDSSVTARQRNRPVVFIGPPNTLMELKGARECSAELLAAPWAERDLALGLYRAVQGPVHAGQSENTNSGKRRVLVVDDDSTIRELVKKTLQRAGLDCRAVADGNQALAIAQSWNPDVALVDVEMPGKNGFDVLSSLRSDLLTFDIPVILLTACQRQSEVIQGLQLGANDYIIKPFNAAALLARVRKLLRTHVRTIWLGTPGSGGAVYT